MLLASALLAGLASLVVAEPLLTAKALLDGSPALPLGLHRRLRIQEPVSYTHLTLPTIYSV